MDGNEAFQPPEGGGHLDNATSTGRSRLNRRQPSFINPLATIRRMGSKLTPSRAKGVADLPNITSNTNLSNQPSNLPVIPEPVIEGKISDVLERLDDLADHPNYLANPAPGLDPKKQLTPQKDNADTTTRISPMPAPRRPSSRLPRSILPSHIRQASSRQNTIAQPASFGSEVQKRNSDIQIANLMGPIQPGQETQRGMPRSSTTGTMNRGQSGWSQKIGSKTNDPSFMRETSSSLARRTSNVGNSHITSSSNRIPSRTGEYSRRKSDEISSRDFPVRSSALTSHPPGQPEFEDSKSYKHQPSDSSRARRATTDIPLRKLYDPDVEGSKVTKPRPRFKEHFTDSKEDFPHDSLSLGKPPLREIRDPLSSSVDSELGITVTRFAKQQGRVNEVKTPEWLKNPTQGDGEGPRMSEAVLRDSVGNTPLNFTGSRYVIDPPISFDFDIDTSRLRPDALDDQHEELESPHLDQSEASAKRWKECDDMNFSRMDEMRAQHVKQRRSTGFGQSEAFNDHGEDYKRMGYYGEEECTERHREGDSSEGDTVIHRGPEESYTDSISTVMRRIDTAGSTSLDDHEDADDPRNVYDHMPSAYWSGRVTGLSDRFRNETLNVQFRVQPHNHPMTDDTRRMRCVFGELAGFCKTSEAKKSLDEFAAAYWNKLGRPFEGPSTFPGTALHVPVQGLASMEQIEVVETPGKKEKEKKGVLGRLGLRRKSGV